MLMLYIPAQDFWLRCRTLQKRAGIIISPLSAHRRKISRQWATKLTLVNPSAPYFNNKELLIASDCSPFVYGDFHRKILRGKPLITVCPMLGLGEVELEKLEQILRLNPIESINLVLMEVPCCQKIKLILDPILQTIDRQIKVKETVIGRDGSIIRNRKI